MNASERANSSSPFNYLSNFSNGILPVHCYYCDAEIDTRKIVLHFSTGTVTAPCDNCKLENVSSGIQKIEILDHESIPPFDIDEIDKIVFPCPQCPKTFSLKFPLKKHILAAHSSPAAGDEKKESTKDQGEVKSREECLLSANCCSKKEANTAIKETPETILSKPFECTYCHKKFVYRSMLAHHIRCHTGEKPYVCNQCGKKFSYKDNLAGHIKWVHNRKSVACEHCGKKLSSKHSLADHVRLHTGEKPFKCKFCESCFSSWLN